MVSKRRIGNEFEKRVRAKLEAWGFTVVKWMNNIDDKGNLVPAKGHFNPYTRALLMSGAGFPDFIAFKRLDNGDYQVWGVECKTSGYLRADEKAKMKWYRDNKTFSVLFVAKPKPNTNDILFAEQTT